MSRDLAAPEFAPRLTGVVREAQKHLFSWVANFTESVWKQLGVRVVMLTMYKNEKGLAFIVRDLNQTASSNPTEQIQV